jgi:hypothetical protein
VSEREREKKTAALLLFLFHNSAVPLLLEIIKEFGLAYCD